MLLALLPTVMRSQELLRLARSSIAFISDAAQERIDATTEKAAGVLNLDDRSFVVQVPVRSFEGFNSPLQREHFNENYLESSAHPNAVFKGRIIEAVELGTPGSYDVRAKGIITIHGVERERIIACTVVVAPDGVRVTSRFDVLLEDHSIRVPGVVRFKIAPVVQVSVDLLFRPGTKVQ